MEAKDVLYAAVGAPVVAARKVGDRVSDWRERMTSETTGYGKTAEKTIEEWATEGKKVIDQIGSGNVVEEISSKVDLDQAKEQVSKLRDQLEDILDTWRASFRPEKVDTAPAQKQPAKAPAKTPTPKSPPAKSSAAKPGAAKSSTAKTSAAKSGTAKPGGAKSSTTKTSAAPEPAAKKPAAKTGAAKQPGTTSEDSTSTKG